MDLKTHLFNQSISDTSELKKDQGNDYVPCW